MRYKYVELSAKKWKFDFMISPSEEGERKKASDYIKALRYEIISIECLMMAIEDMVQLSSLFVFWTYTDSLWSETSLGLAFIVTMVSITIKIIHIFLNANDCLLPGFGGQRNVAPQTEEDSRPTPPLPPASTSSRPIPTHQMGRRRNDYHIVPEEKEEEKREFEEKTPGGHLERVVELESLGSNSLVGALLAGLSSGQKGNTAGKGSTLPTRSSEFESFGNTTTEESTAISHTGSTPASLDEYERT